MSDGPRQPAALSRCPALGRWLPRVLGGAVLAAVLIAVLGIESESSSLGRWRGMLAATGALAALWITRAGSEVYLEAGIVGDVLRIGGRGRFIDLPIADIDALDFDPPFTAARRWPAAWVVIDRHERRFRIPACIEDGPALVEAVVSRSGGEGLRAWAEARRIPSRMAASRAWIAAGYLFAGAVLAGALWLSGGRP